MASKTENVPVPFDPFGGRMDKTTITDNKGTVQGVGTAYSPRSGSTKESSEESQRKASEDYKSKHGS